MASWETRICSEEESLQTTKMVSSQLQRLQLSDSSEKTSVKPVPMVHPDPP